MAPGSSSSRNGSSSPSSHVHNSSNRTQVGPLGACDGRPEEQQRQQQQSQEGSVSAGGYNPGNQQPVEEEVDGVDGVEGGGGLVMELQHKVMGGEQQQGTIIRMDAGGRWCWGGEGFPPFAPD